jgi:hypothetical protein
MIHNMVNFYSEELLAPRPTSKLEDQLLLTVCNCLFNIYTATLYIRNRSSIHNLLTYHATVTGIHLSCDELWAQNFIFKKDIDQLLVFTNQTPSALMVSSPLLLSCPPRMTSYRLLRNPPPATSTPPGTSLREPLGEPGSLKSKLMALLEEDGAVSFPTQSPWLHSPWGN